jgi:hypothetical protein
VVVSDFGRDAALRFCAELARRELALVSARLPDGAAFYDEYRRITLHVVGDLRFIKEPWLASYVADERPFDDRVLVGFEGGPPLEEVVPRIGALVVEALAGPTARRSEQAVVTLPCNTLAPASWALEQSLSSPEGIRALARTAGYHPVGLDEVAERLAGQVLFPTVPQAVLWRCERSRAKFVLPLGTPGIVDVYAQTAQQQQSSCTVVRPDERWQTQVLEAIGASVAGDPERRRASSEALLAIRDGARDRFGEDVIVVEACTDLDYGIGVDSGREYARFVVSQVYNQETVSAPPPEP